MRKVRRRPGESTYSFRKRARLCHWCGSPDLVTRSHCAKHRERFNRTTLPGARRRVRRRSADRREAGLCVACGRPAVNRTHCEDHRLMHNEHMRAYLARKAGRQPKPE